MAYVSLYRRFRPNSFDSVIGQDHLVRILKNQVKNGKVSHAYLFTGTRGVGKTSVAKIFAKAINCLNSIDGSPCGECEVCRNISNSYDIVEMDAASNNGVDAIRELQESVKYPPTLGKYKVFIIDEVHMLTINAFNTLLKTLEEPPQHIVFILATTELHQLPATVLSRCLKFDFRLVSTKIIADRVKFIFDEIGVKYEQQALTLIAEAGDGSVRDALSVADMCVSFGEGNVGYNDVLEVLGSSNPLEIIDVVGAIIKGDLSTALSKVDNICNLGKSMGALVRDLAKMFRNLYYIIKVDNANSLLGLPDEIYSKLANLATNDSVKILQIIEILGGVESKLRYAGVPRIVVEAAIARAADPVANIDVNGLVTRLKILENNFAQGGTTNVVPMTKPQNGSAITNNNQENGNSISSNNQVQVQNDATPSLKVLTARNVLAELLKQTRVDSHLLLREQLNDLTVDSFKVGGDSVVIEVSDKVLYNALISNDNMLVIRGIINKEFGATAEIKLLNYAKDITGDVEFVKSLFDKEIISIHK